MNSSITQVLFTADENVFKAAAPSKRVLLVDDNAEVRDVCAELLRRHGFSVDLCSDGEEGWNAFSENSYDIVITDHNMPRLSGLDLVRRIRAAERSLPIVLISGNVPWHDGDLPWILRPGVVLEKPFSFAELLRSVTKLTAVRAGDFAGFGGDASSAGSRHQAALNLAG